jgi:hypothetical protein
MHHRRGKSIGFQLEALGREAGQPRRDGVFIMLLCEFLTAVG